MRVVTSNVLESCLMILSRVPGRCMLLLLPVMAFHGKIHQKLFTAKADSNLSSQACSTAELTNTTAAAAGGSGGGLGERAGGVAAVVSKLLGPNEFASGGMTLMVVGAAAAGARSLALSAMRYMRRHVMITAEIDSRDDAYRWVMHWLSQHPRFKQSTSVSVATNLSCFGTAAAAQPLGASSVSAGSGPPVAYLPAPGDHLLRYRGKWMCISRQRATGNPQLAANARLLLETLRITMLGTNRSALDALLSEAAAAYNHSQSCRTAVHSVDQDGYWTQVGSRPIRPLNTVVLPQGQAESLLLDCQEFLGSEEWYAHHGIPYRRGYLLYGPPGTGKTSLVMALAGALGLEIYVVTLSSPTMTDETLRNLLNSAGTRSILLLEDVDAAFVDRAAGSGAGRLTFSGLLNAIDGVAAQEGRLLFMTTNHIERLNSALIRPGRVDVRCYLGPATRQQARDLFVSFYRDLPHLLLRPHGKKTPAVPAAAAVPECLTSTEELTPVPGQSLTGSDIAQSTGNAADSSKEASADRSATKVSQQLHRSASSAVAAAAAAEAAERERVLQGLATQFAKQLPVEGGVSMAQLQGYLMTHRKDPWEAVQDVSQLLLQHHVQQQEDS